MRRLLIAVMLFATPALANEPAPPAITVVTVAQTVLRDRVIASGLVGPVEQVQVQPLIEGQPIETLAADVGDTVTAGQVLARLSTATLDLQRSEVVATRASALASVAQAEAQAVEARAAADEARSTADRTASLNAQGATSQAAADTANANARSTAARVNAADQSVEAARAQVTLAEAQIANIDLQLSRTAVTAPVGGEIVERNAVIGAIASAQGTPMFTLIRDGALELRADVAETDLLRLAPGQTAQLTVPGAAPLTGTVRLVEPRVDETSRLGRVRITVADPSALRAGMFAAAEVLVEERNVTAVPLSALGQDAEGSFVMVVQDGTVHRASVTSGIRDSAMVGVSGLTAGQQVVAKAGAFVRDGDRVTPVEAAP